MANPARVKKEIDDLKRDTVSGVLIEQIGGSHMHLKGTIKGPSDTPYAGGTFHVDINIPADYPFSPPKMKFITKLWHPNVSSQTGAICLDILKDQWSPALTIKTALISLQALMCTPEPNDPQDAEVANMYLSNYEQFKNKAKFWTESYAKEGESNEPSPAVKRLMEMGFNESDVKKALAQSGGDENAAVESLLSSL
mmetsp:Transcript_25150/g.22870  ORF Transcript_25150/g.22870 Transcript_25150/m.22870 type:complete len:196 (-) Transcript_25150:1557-2144(-)|eukprot:CAMPEP_0196761480 /NCGR_PEP_ID=MMETSP1095-20130614/727_1 /TAXON_ID=96789 ORGANISM="Chromulina nebulosa, Strain UTEXLB2642" /NCGR_SAMPLE_ID=MMETSP1095 /ASSEMBLY_ACC=CAM_ASM_000446 /LENGTH=195 /DNA_ID=CAMNT_0042111081 /DNA_START=47 /DNA_END=634 /DNA_ORIENTATION=+